MAKTTRGKKAAPKKGSRKASRKGAKRSSRKGSTSKKVQRKTVKPSTKYKTGSSDDYEGTCKQDKVQKCVDQGKYCNLETNQCIAPKGVKTKVNKDKSLAVDPKYGVVGKTQAVNNIKKYLEMLNKSEQKKLDIGISTEITESPPVVKKAKKTVKKAAKKASAKKSCTQEECEDIGKICNPDTGNCINDTAANRKKVGLPPKSAKKAAKKPSAKKTAKKPSAAKKAPSAAPAKDYSKMLVKDLKEELGKRGLSKTGKKDDLIKRLKDDDKKAGKAPSAKKAPSGAAKDYDNMLVKDLKEELGNRGLSKTGNKAVLIQRLKDDDKKKAAKPPSAKPPTPTPSPTPTPTPTPPSPTPTPPAEENCADDGCETGEVCNVDTGKCSEPGKAKVKNLHMLTYNGSVYYGSMAALLKFAVEMGIDDPEIEKATKTKMNKALGKAKPSPQPPVPSAPTEPSPPAEPSPPGGLDIDALIGGTGEVPPESPDEDVSGVAAVLHDVSTEKPLTKQQQEMVEKIRKCIGI